MKGDEFDYSNYQGLSLLPSTYRILSDILLWTLTPYVGKINEVMIVDFDVTG